MYSKYGFRSLRPSVSLQFLIKNSKGMGPEASGSLRPSVSLEFLIENIREITPEASGASGLQFPENSLLKTIGKLLRKPPERLASFFRTIPYNLIQNNKEITPEASGASGLQFAQNSL